MPDAKAWALADVDMVCQHHVYVPPLLCCLQSCCSDVVNVNTATGQVDVQLHDISRKAPLLLTELVVASDNNSFCYSTALDSIGSRITAIFDRALTKLQVR
jgi:hypothetical protein